MIEIVFGLPLGAIQPPLSWWGLMLAALLMIIRNDVIHAMVYARALWAAGLTVQVSSTVLLAGALTPVWWHQWMSGNWAGPPVWLSDVVHQTIDRAAWTVQADMTIALFGLLASLVLLGNLFSGLRSSISRAPV